jgi:hypothetical protein
VIASRVVSPVGEVIEPLIVGRADEPTYESIADASAWISSDAQRMAALTELWAAGVSLTPSSIPVAGVPGQLRLPMAGT